MYTEKINKPIFDFEPTHPARRFLDAFIECRKNCVGRELEGIDQEWFSESERCIRRFSSFAYEWLSFDIELDGWLQNAKEMTASERRALETIPQMRGIIEDCRQAAVDDENADAVNMCDEVLRMSELWEECINYRLRGLRRGGV
jgi:hypothetical protein